MSNLLKKFNLPPSSKGHAVAVLIVTPQGIPLIRDPKKPLPVFWKLPGGRGEATETAEECAVREIKEELGVSIPQKSLQIVHSEDKGSHVLTIFRVNLTKFPKMKSRGDEGEEIHVFHPKDILAEPYFFPNHRKIVGGILSTLL